MIPSLASTGGRHDQRAREAGEDQQAKAIRQGKEAEQGGKEGRKGLTVTDGVVGQTVPRAAQAHQQKQARVRFPRRRPDTLTELCPGGP